MAGDRKKVVVDTSLFMINTDLVKELMDEYQVVIPVVVLEELDNLKDNYRDKTRSLKGRYAIKFINQYIDEFIFDDYESDIKADNQIIKVAKEYGNLATNDLCLKIKAKLYDINVIEIDVEIKEYKGYRVLDIDTTIEDDNNLLAKLYQNPKENILELNNNEYLIIKDKSCPIYDEDYDFKIDYKTLNIMKWNGSEYIQLKLPPKKVIAPLNDLQSCALDLLMDKNIPIKIIAGVYGSGKTLLSTVIGLYLVDEKGQYSKLVLVRNNDLNDSGKEIGALPGNFDEKTDILFQTSIQHFPQGEYQAEKMKNEGKLETHITYFIKGLSISGFMLVDEAEDLTLKDIKLVGSRIEENSCIVFSGDWKQANGKFRDNNGLIQLINQTIGNPLVGVIVLDNDVRSDASKIFADLM